MSNITAAALLSTLPTVLQNDASMAALASAIADKLAARVTEIDGVAIYAGIDSLPEDLVDILAKDFKVDWLDADYTLAEKRQTLKDNWSVHRRMGTPNAVATAISAIYADSSVSEWWEYNGSPYHFRILINSTYEEVDPTKHARVLARVAYYKNLRSVLDSVEYYDTGGSAPAYGMAALLGYSIVDGATAVRV